MGSSANTVACLTSGWYDLSLSRYATIFISKQAFLPKSGRMLVLFTSLQSNL